MTKKIILFLLLLISFNAFCQGLYKNSEKARYAFAKGDYSTSVEGYRAIVSRIKNDELKSLAYYNLGTSLLKNGNYVESVDAFYQGLPKIKGEYKPRLLYNLSYALFKCNRKDESLTTLRDAITIKPDFEEAKILYEWILKQKSEEPPPPENQQEPPPPPPMLEELPPPPPEVLQDEIEQNQTPGMKPW